MTEAGGPVVVSFVAPGRASGRTSVAANLAWMLASSGQNVLVVDWDSRGTSIHDYLRPFLIDEITGSGIEEMFGAPLAGALDRSATLGFVRSETAGDRPVLRRYAPAGPGPGVRLDVVEHRIALAEQADSAAAVTAFNELRSGLLAARYDYVLLDGPPSAPGSGALLAGRIADRVVLCFQSRPADVGTAARLAVDIVRESPAEARIVAVPTFLDTTDPGRALEQANEIWQTVLRALRKADFPISDRLLQLVAIPFHTMVELLVPLVFDRVEQRESLLRAYADLLRTVTDNRVAAPPAPAPSLIGRYRDLIRSSSGGSSAESRRVDVVYSSADRPWADWIAGQVEGAGARVNKICFDLGSGPPPSGAVIIAGAGLPFELTDLASPAGYDLIVARVEPGVGAIPGTRDVVLHDCTAVRARWRVLAALAMSGAPGQAGRLPSAGPRPDFKVPFRDRATVHRAKEFEAVRDALLTAGHGGRVLITGSSGTGKTELAKEYAYSYAHEYQITWFVPAHTRQAARESLIDLGRRVGADGDDEDLPAAVLRLAALDYQPYLLIYDDVADFAALEGLVPDEDSGHVIYTRTSDTLDESPAAEATTVVWLPGLEREQARTTLRRQLRDLAEADLGALVDAVGTDPLTIRLTCGCLRAAGRVLRTSEAMSAGEASTAVVARFLNALPERSPDAGPADRLAAVVRCLLELLDAYPDGQVVAALALMCANLSADGVALRLIRSSQFLSGLVNTTRPEEAVQALVHDAAEIEIVLANAASVELISVDWGRRRQLRMHRMVQRMLRRVAEPMRFQEVRWGTMLALSAYAPNDAEYLAGDGAEELADLAPHVEPVGALEEPELTAVRRWVVVHVGSIARDGGVEEREAALALVDRVKAAWGERATDPLGVRLAMHEADLLRSLGRDSEALAIDLAMRDLPQTTPAGGELRTALNWRGTPGDLRGVGVFDRALTEDKTIYRALRTMLGPDHPQTLQSRHNLALSNYLDGRQVDAAKREEETYRTRRRLDENDLLTWWCAIDLAIYRRELGQLTDSRLLLTEAADRLRSIVGEEHRQTIRAGAALAVTERRAGDFALAKTHSSKASVAFRKTLGERSLVTQGATLSMAIDYSFTGDMAKALDITDICLAEFRRHLAADHPFIAIGLTNLAGLQRRAGRAVDAARSAEAAEAIFTRLSAAHPWTIAARINRANALADRGRTEEAAEVHARTRRTAARFLPAKHPYLAALAYNSKFIDGSDSGPPPPGAAGTGPVDIDVEIPST